MVYILASWLLTGIVYLVHDFIRDGKTLEGGEES